jgi:hypothetical protein
MTPKDNILQELNEWKSPLAQYAPQNVYTVPAGYFEGLAAQVLSRIKAMETASVSDELSHLSAVLQNTSTQTPYTIPVGYFEALPGRMLDIIRTNSMDASNELNELSPLLSKLSKQLPYTVPAGYFETLEATALSNSTTAKAAEESVSEELATLSPLLGGLKKEMPYSVPAGYFDNLAAEKNTPEIKPAAKVISFTSRKWFRYAAAAAVIGLIATIGFMFINQDKVTADKDSYAWIKKSFKKVSTEKIDEFIQLTDTEKSVATATTKVQEVKELVKDVPETEIQSLLNDTQLLDDSNIDDDVAEDILMN